MRCSLNTALFGIFTSLTLLACATSARAQFRPNRSDQDLNAIGHRNVGSSVNCFSQEKEIALGKQLAQEVERSSKVIEDSVISEYLNRLGQNIAKNSDAKLPVNFRIIDSNEINSFTLPGGYQYVNRGLILATNSEAELAGVLAYGIAHTAMRTGTKQATKAELMQVSSMASMVFISYYAWAGYDLNEGSNVEIPLASLKFSRDAVRAADFYAVQYLYKSGYDANAYTQFMERALQKPRKSQAAPMVFSSHPPVSERVQALREEIARLLPPRSDENPVAPDFEAVKARLRARQTRVPSAPAASLENPTLRKPEEPL